MPDERLHAKLRRRARGGRVNTSSRAGGVAQQTEKRAERRPVCKARMDIGDSHEHTIAGETIEKSRSCFQRTPSWHSTHLTRRRPGVFAANVSHVGASESESVGNRGPTSRTAFFAVEQRKENATRTHDERVDAKRRTRADHIMIAPFRFHGHDPPSSPSIQVPECTANLGYCTQSPGCAAYHRGRPDFSIEWCHLHLLPWYDIWSSLATHMPLDMYV